MLLNMQTTTKVLLKVKFSCCIDSLGSRGEIADIQPVQTHCVCVLRVFWIFVVYFALFPHTCTTSSSHSPHLCFSASLHLHLITSESKLLLSVSETNELMLDSVKSEAKTQTPVYTSGAEVEVNSYRFFWNYHHTSPWLKKHRKGWTSNGNLKRLNSGQLLQRSNKRHPDWEHHNHLKNAK